MVTTNINERIEGFIKRGSTLYRTENTYDKAVKAAEEVSIAAAKSRDISNGPAFVVLCINEIYVPVILMSSFISHNGLDGYVGDVSRAGFYVV